MISLTQDPAIGGVGKDAVHNGKRKFSFSEVFRKAFV